MSPKCWRSARLLKSTSLILLTTCRMQLAGLHVVVGVLEDVAHDAAAVACLPGGRELLELREQLVVDEVSSSSPVMPSGIGRPGAPAELRRDRRLVAVLHELELLILVVDDLEEEHPAELGDALGVAVDAAILAHDVLDGLDGVANGHGLGYASGKGRPAVRARRASKSAALPNSLDQLRRAFPSRRTAGSAGLRGSSRSMTPSSWYFCSSASSTARACGPYLVKTSRLRTLSARSRRVSGGWSKATWQMRSKGSRSLPTSSASGSSGQPFVLEFLDDGLLALGGFPALEELVEAGEALLQRLLREIPQALGDQLAVLVEILDALGDDRGPYPVDIDLALRLFAGADGDVRRLARR